MLKPTDFKGTAVVDLVIGTSGQVVGVKAVRAWTFRPEKVNDQAVAYLGIEFDLCNISCNQQGVSLSIVRCPL